MKSEKAEDLLRALGDEPLPAESEAARQARRERIVPVLEATIARKKRPVWPKVVLPLVAAAVVALGVGAALRSRAPGPAPSAAVARAFGTDGAAFRVHVGSADLVSPSGADVMANDELTTSPSAHARIAMGAGPVLEMAAASDVVVTDASRASVVAGRVSVFVPELGAGKRVSVLALNAIIDVDERASFEVDADQAAGTVRLHVAEGSVHVTAGGARALVTAGQDWPAATETDTPPPPTAPTASAPTTVTTASPARSAGPTTAPQNGAASQLAEQNRLLQSALDARKSGDPTRALAVLDELLTRFPKSPLAQAARVERFRCLEQAGKHAAAAAEAQKYLADYPDGFARAEATALVK